MSAHNRNCEELSKIARAKYGTVTLLFESPGLGIYMPEHFEPWQVKAKLKKGRTVCYVLND